MWREREKQQLSLLQPRSLSTRWNPMSKSIVICSSFQTSFIIDQGPNTSCNWAIKYRKNFSLSLCQSTSTPAHLSWWYSRRGPNMYLCCIQSWIYHSIVPHSLVYWPCHSSQWRWQIGQSKLHRDLCAALQEVLDLKQNWSFNNDYINVPTYLSQDLFVYTANFLDTIFAVTWWMWNSTSGGVFVWWKSDHCEQVFGAQVDWDEWIEAAMSEEMDKRGRGEEFGADYYWCCDVQSCTVGRMKGETWERWICSFVGRIGIIVILDNYDVHPNCPPLWPRNYLGLPCFSSDTPSLFPTVIQINVHVVFTVSLWRVNAKEESWRWVGVGATWLEGRLWMMFLSV